MKELIDELFALLDLDEGDTITLCGDGTVYINGREHNE